MRRTVYLPGSICFLLFFSFIGFAQQLTDLPTFRIQTAGNVPVNSKTNYVQATLTINSSNEQESVTGLPLGIRGRGNSTWWMSKKPYRIKLDAKRNLLGLPSREKDWVLLANYADKTLIRNAVASKISELINLEYSPSFRFVDVVLNGSYIGNYMLTDQIEVGTHRAPVEKLNPTDTENPIITGGYLLEIDGFASGEPLWFQTPKGLKITIKYPDSDEINTQQKNYIKNFLLDFEAILFSANFRNEEVGYRALVDENSLINWYIACELTGNSDAFWSTYLYKKRNDNHIYFGPLWDYDIAFNNEVYLFDTYDAGVDYLKTCIQERIAFLTSSFSTADLDESSEPFVAENFYYWVMNKRTNNAIGSTDNARNPGDWLSLWEMKEEDDNQLWKIEPMVNYYFRFIHKSSNLAMAGAGKGDNLVLTTIDDNDAKQLWRIVPVLTGNIYGIVNVATGYSVNNSSGDFANGTPVIEWDNNITSPDKLNQHWYIQKAEAIVSNSVPVVDTFNPAVRMDSYQLQVYNLPVQASVQIYNLQGIPVAEKQGSGEITFESPPPGIYILRITTKNQVRSIKLNVQFYP
jgi:hypothetical protein